MITLTEVKNQAAVLKEYLKQNNSGISHSSCLHAIAKIHGYRDWNTMSANLEKKQKSKLDFVVEPNQEAVFDLFDDQIMGGVLYYLLDTCQVTSIEKINNKIVPSYVFYVEDTKLEVECHTYDNITDLNEKRFLQGKYIGATIIDILEKRFQKFIGKSSIYSGQESLDRKLKREESASKTLERCNFVGKKMKFNFCSESFSTNQTLNNLKSYVEKNSVLNIKSYLNMLSILTDEFGVGTSDSSLEIIGVNSEDNAALITENK